MLDFWDRCCYSHHVPQWISQLTVARTTMGPMKWVIVTRYRNVDHWQHPSKGRKKLGKIHVLISGVAMKTTDLKWHCHMPHSKWLIWKRFQGLWWQTVSPWRLNAFGVFHSYIGCFESNQLKIPLVSTTNWCDTWTPKSTGTSPWTDGEDVDSRCKMLALHGEFNDSREVWHSMANNKSQVEGFEGMDKAPIFVGIREYLCKDIPWDLEFTSFGAQSHSKKRTDMVPQLY